MKRLTYKQAKFVKAKAKGMSGTQAAQVAYPKAKNINTAAVISSENLSKPKIQEALDAELITQNITIPRAIKPISIGLDAVKMNEYTGEVTPDINTQLKASDRALKLLGIGYNSGNTAFINVINIDKDKYKM